jgi:hypothetical protein
VHACDSKRIVKYENTSAPPGKRVFWFLAHHNIPLEPPTVNFKAKLEQSMMLGKVFYKLWLDILRITMRRNQPWRAKDEYRPCLKNRGRTSSSNSFCRNILHCKRESSLVGIEKNGSNVLHKRSKSYLPPGREATTSLKKRNRSGN